MSACQLARHEHVRSRYCRISSTYIVYTGKQYNEISPNQRSTPCGDTNGCQKVSAINNAIKRANPANPEPSPNLSLTLRHRVERLKPRSIISKTAKSVSTVVYFAKRKTAKSERPKDVSPQLWQRSAAANQTRCSNAYYRA